MKLRNAVICLVALSLCLAGVALVAGPPPPEATLTVTSVRGPLYNFWGSAKKGAKPYSYFWSVDGGGFEEGGQSYPFFLCDFNMTLDFKVIDDLGQESNVESFVCP